jgi:hypothetical protein
LSDALLDTLNPEIRDEPPSRTIGDLAGLGTRQTAQRCSDSGGRLWDYLYQGSSFEAIIGIRQMCQDFFLGCESD